MFMPWAVLGLGFVAAGIASRAVPVPPALHLDLPAWVAERVSTLATPERDLVITRPQVLWLVPITLVPFVIAMALRSLVDVRPAQVALQLLARTAVLMSLTLALSMPTLRAPIRGKTVVFAVDVSKSIDDEQLDGAQRLVADALRLAAAERERGVEPDDRTRVRVLSYAGRARAVELAEAAVGIELPRDPEHGLSSDHAGALRLATALLDPDTEGRVVLITDGAGDLAERQGLVRQVAELERHDVAVHIRRFEAQARDDILVKAVHLPDELRVGQTFDVAIDLISSSAGKARLQLMENDRANALAPSLEIDLVEGLQQVKMPARVSEAGPVVFRAVLDPATLDAAMNAETANDAAAAVGEVRGRPRVLHVGSDGTGALARALGADHLEVDDVSPGEVPTGAEGLRRYDLVVFSDVPARSVSPDAQRAVARYVKELGGGFIMGGGENSYGVGKWGGTAIESILPVRFSGERQREQPTLALVLVIDKSGSMSSEEKLDLVKEAARATARTLDASDEIGVIAFDQAPQVLVRLQTAANRLRISSAIRRLSASGGTDAGPALREAYLQLAGSKALVKHVILLSDGQSPESGIPALISDMRNADITVSAVGVGAGAGKDFLSRVAERGRGRYYFSQDGTDVPRIFSREAKEVTRNALVERMLYPRVAKSVQALRGIDFSSAPGLRGIVPVKPKAQSETLLRTHMGDALLVRGRRGLGRTLAFASDAKPRWAASWLTWRSFAKFWSQLARDTMRQGTGVLGGAHAHAAAAAEPGAWQVVVDVDSPVGFANELEGHVVIVDPAAPKAADAEETAEKVPLSLTAPGRYEATVRGVRTGQRLLRARLYDASQTPRRLAAESVTSVSIPYPPELMPVNAQVEPAWLAEVAGASISGPIDDIVTSPGRADGRLRTEAIWPMVLVWLTLPLLILDLFLRRISFGLRKIRA
jgi:Mg-chelatase subunit ChlD